MSSAHVAASRRNAVVMGASGLTVGLLFLYPTSTNSGSTHGFPAKPAKVGVVGSTSKQPAKKTADVVVNGAVADTAYGPVQVQLTVHAGKIVKAEAIVYPQGSSRDREINSQAIPALDQETVSAQSANIDTISGATYTSDGYRRSLQAALDAAHL